MKSKLKIVFLCLLLGMHSAVFSQTIDQLEQLINLQDLASKDVMQEEQRNGDEDTSETNKSNQINNSDEQQNNEGSEFGFTGRQDFLVAPKAEFSVDDPMANSSKLTFPTGIKPW